MEIRIKYSVMKGGTMWCNCYKCVCVKCPCSGERITDWSSMGWGGVIRSWGQFGGCVILGEVVFRGTGSLVTGIRYSM